MMGFMGKLVKFIGVSTVVVVAVLLGPINFPESVTFTEFDISPLKNLGNSYTRNELLNNVERLFEGEIKGPEGFAVLNGDLYTTLHGGYVAKVYEDQIIPVVKFGQPCEAWWQESICGRPLGIKAVGNDYLFVADAYYGIFKYNVKNRKINKLVDKNVIIEGKGAKVFNSLDVAKDGSIYYSSSSTDFTIGNCIFIFLADGSGRLIKYDPQTNTNTVLMDGLYLANGVVLSPNEDFVLIAESGKNRIHKFHLKGPKKFKNEIFIDGLPGTPDNLRTVGEDRVFASFFSSRSETHPLYFQYLSKFPTVRKFLARFLFLVQSLMIKLDEVYPNNLIKKGIHYVGHLESISWAFPPNITLLEMNWKGDVVRSYHGSDGTFSALSDVIIHNGYLYLGSPISEYLGRVPLVKLGEKISVKTPKVTSAKPKQTPPAAQKPVPITTKAPEAKTTPLPPPVASKPSALPPSKTQGRPSSPPPSPQVPGNLPPATHSAQTENKNQPV